MQSLAEFFLWFGQATPIVLIVGLGYWGYRRHTFSHVLFLLLLSMVVNAFLKCWFQVPLKSHLGEGWYAFPSGHMQLATVFYGRLWWEFRQKKLVHLIPLLLIGLAWAMISKNYHDVSDVLAGAAVGVGLLILYGGFERLEFIHRHTEKIGLILLPLTAILIAFTSAPREHISHIWQAQGGLLGLSLGMIILRKMQISEFSFHSEKRWIGVIKILLGFGVFVLLWNTNKIFLGSLGYPGFPLVSFFLLGMWLSAGPDLVVSFKRFLKR
jgi:hypothetical protein